MKTQLLNNEVLCLQDLTKNELHLVNGGTATPEGVGYLVGNIIGFTVGALFGTVVNVGKFFTGNL